MATGIRWVCDTVRDSSFRRSHRTRGVSPQSCAGAVRAALEKRAAAVGAADDTDADAPTRQTAQVDARPQAAGAAAAHRRNPLAVSEDGSADEALRTAGVAQADREASS